MATPAQTESKPTDVLSVLMDMRNGQVAADISTKFNEVLAAVLDTAGEGELVIKLKLKPGRMGSGRAVLEVVARHECKLKKPELEIGGSQFFVTRDGRLSRNDPNQEDMFTISEAKETK
jgi:hypothetical protein